MEDGLTDFHRHDIFTDLWRRIDNERYEYFDLVEPTVRHERVVAIPAIPEPLGSPSKWLTLTQVWYDVAA